jgi:Tol biopolymer transport system component/DNA-binding winged helix-turn-helix (wHTH) protein
MRALEEAMAVIAGNGSRTKQFGIFELDLRAGELRRNGSKVKLQEQPLQILTMLLEKPGDVVTRAELQKKLWPADTFVDFDHSLNAAIRRLRDTLGDTAENPRFVETVARRGYRFLTPVNGASAEPEPPPPVPPSTSRSKRWLVITVAAVLMVGARVGWFLSRGLTRPMQVRERRLTANPEEDPVAGGVISPDGKYLAFSDSTGFYLREIDSGETHPLVLPKTFTPLSSTAVAAWNPDGTHLIVSWVDGPRALPSLWQISLMGGAPRKLVDDARYPAVSSDGSQIVFVRGASTDQEIWIMQADGEKPRRVVPGESGMFGTPVWSPDGRRIAYLASAYEPAHWGMSTRIEILDLATGRKETNFAGLSLRLGLAWTPDGQLIFSLGEPPPNENDSNVWSVRVDRNGHISGPPVRLTATTGDVAELNASADGKRITYIKHWLQPDVYVAELNAARTRLSTPKRLTLDERNDYPFAWTPDSKAVLFSSDRDGPYHIFEQGIDQSVPELLVGGEEQAMSPRLTPDDSTIVYITWPKLGKTSTDVGLMRLSLAGGPPQVVLRQDGIGNLQCSRPPSNVCIYDTRRKDRMSFFRFDPATGKSEEVPQVKVQDQPSYAYNWSLSPDGKTLAIEKREGLTLGDPTAQRGPTITFFSMADGSKRTVEVEGWAGVNSIDWAADGRSLWAGVHSNTGTWALVKIDLHGHATTVLEDTRMTVGWAIPAPDGKHIALWKASGSSNIWMLERFSSTDRNFPARRGPSLN